MAEKKKKLWIGIGIGMAISIITMGALFLILCTHFVLGEQAEPVTGAENYDKVLAEYDAVQSGLIVFPEKIPESAEDTEFYAYSREPMGSPIEEFFLQYRLNQADYDKEIRRLEKTRKCYGSVVRCLEKDTSERFSFPVYIAVDGHAFVYEYALLTGEREITYIYTSCFSKDELEKIDEVYLPSDYDERQDLSDVSDVDASRKNYNIYLIKEDNALGGWDYDYSRDEIVDVEAHHYEEIGYNLFYVNTVLDRQDRQVIESCEYVYYENGLDAFFGLPEEIVFKELKGFPFKALELNREKTEATVSYYENGVVKQKAYPIPSK